MGKGRVVLAEGTMWESWDLSRRDGSKSSTVGPRQWYGDERQAREAGRPQMTRGLTSHARELGLHPMDKRSLWEGFQEGCGVSCSSFRTSLRLPCKNGML